MAVRQYVGARYVPKFYQNSQNPLSSEWEGNMAYDALTIVTYNNSSYTSKIPVPAGIGNPAQNPTYWVVTGNYNAQVEQYREDAEKATETAQTVQGNLNSEVTTREEADTTLQTNINKAKKRTFILIGDSLGVGYVSSTGRRGRGWIKWFQDLFPQFNFIVGGYEGNGLMGFTSGSDGHAFYNALSNVIMPTGLEKTDVTDIVVLGGTNDYFNGASNKIYENISAFCDYARANFPYATVRVGCFCEPRCSLGAEHGPRSGWLSDAYKSVEARGGVYINGLERMLCDNSLFGANINGAPDVHLTQAGYDFYSPIAINAVMTGKADYHFVLQSSGAEGTYYFTDTTIVVDKPPVFRYSVYPDHIDVRIISTESPGQFCQIHRYMPVYGYNIETTLEDLSGTIRAVISTNKSIIVPMTSSADGTEGEIVGVASFDCAGQPQNYEDSRMDFRIYTATVKAGDAYVRGYAWAIYNC